MGNLKVLSEIMFTSASLYDASRIHAAAIYCLDGRIGAQFDEFW
jgi:hypothetical protein